MSRIPYVLTASRVACLWQLPIERAKHIVHAQLRNLGLITQRMLALLGLTCFILSLGLFDFALAGYTSTSLVFLVDLTFAILYLLIILQVPHRLLARQAIIHDAEIIRARNPDAAQTLQLASGMHPH
ncbi:hypothetical protein [Oleiagrimonas sp.]|jgi:hypothetical protein|uniref:hypothetical protein n=1 Tax=Oleiagrimonas sp. TaxID=2010330 RepID=UPI00260C6011|nr:hypothetical protein [Oleiagrimonas sp.]MDA3913373.1 hypothetical protein [Oleiagrimonas sp.]